MKKEDYKNTYRFLYSYGNKVVVAIKNRIRKDKLVDTGTLLNSIDYEVKDTNGQFQVIFKMVDGVFRKGSGEPSEYGVYLDQGTRYIDPYYFFTAPVPGLTQKDFRDGVAEAMRKDIEIYIAKQAKEIFKS